MKSEKNYRGCLNVSITLKPGNSKWFLLTSDRHHDNAHCSRALEKKHLDEAVERDAHIIDIGDFFCAMQGKWDRRADTTQLRPEYIGGNYLDLLVDEATKFFGPYADRFLQISPGNHETSILKRHETNLTERLVERLNQKSGDHKIHVGGFSGWVRFQLAYQSGKNSRAFNFYYHHGYGGGGPVTRGVIQTNRMATYLPDAHFVYTGHTHDEWLVPIQRARLSQAGKPYQDTQTHIRTPGYKDEFDDGEGGWHIERGGPPKPTGACWLRFYFLNKEFRHEIVAAR